MRNAMKMFGLLSALALSACGGDKGEDLGQFLGTWQPISGVLTIVCQGYTYTSSLGNLTWNTGISSDLVQTSAGSTCAIMAEVNGATATAAPGQICSSPDGSQTTAVAGYTFVVGPDGRTATENGSGTLTLFSGGVTIPCTFNETGSYQKIGR
jgi:hypothetical protein